MMKYFYIIILFFLYSTAISQSGCTDINAINYNAEAKQNDGSCEYSPMVLELTTLNDELPPIIEETSGLIFFQGGLWTHNDSGGQAAIYKLDPSKGIVIQTIVISNGNNIDIEDITQDDEYIYVGDFGNNLGVRDDLLIYKIKKIDIPETGDKQVLAEKIEFSYNDQKSFERRNRTNDFDCESMIAYENHLYVFTKNWVDQETKCYKIPKEVGQYKLDIHSGFNVRGLITSADYHVQNNSLVLTGYENFVPFIWVIWDFKGDNFFKGHKKRAEFAYISGAQTEGVCFINEKQIVISSEDSYFPPSLYQLELNQVISANKHVEKYQPFNIELIPNATKQNVAVSVTGLQSAKFDLEIYNLSWQKVRQYSFIDNDFASKVNMLIPTAELGGGIFFVRIKEGKNVGFQKLVIK